LLLWSHSSSVKYSFPSVAGGETPSSSTDLNHLVTSSKDSDVTSRKVSMEITVLLESWTCNSQKFEDDLVVRLWVTQHGKLVDNAAQPHGEVLDALPIMELEHTHAVASVHLMGSSPLRITLMLSHTSCAESFDTSVVIISSGTTLQIVSSALRSS
jgi:hypothetical protein